MAQVVIKESWRSFAKVTTIHGIHDLVFARAKLTRILWAIVLVGSMGLLAFQLYKVIKGYHDGDTYFKTSVKSMDSYPPIRIIPRTAFNISEAKQLNLSREHFCYLLGFFRDRNKTGDLMKNESISALNQLQTEIDDIIKANNLSTVFDLAESLAWEPEQFLEFVIPSGTGINLTASKIVDTWGVSYEIGVSRMKNQTKYLYNTRSNGKWSIKIKALPDLPYGSWFCAREIPIMISDKATYKIAIGDDLWDPARWVTVKQLVTSQITLSSSEKRLVSKPESPCQKGTTSMMKCMLDCEAPLVYLGPEYLSGTPPNCSTDGTIYFTEDTGRVGKFYNSWYDQVGGPSYCNQTIINQMEDCVKDCKEPCQKRSFGVVVKETGIDTGGTPTIGKIVKDSRVEVTMESGWALELVEEAYVYTPSGLMSAIGGLMGLFTGASVISILQCAAYASFGSWLEKKSAQTSPEGVEGNRK